MTSRHTSAQAKDKDGRELAVQSTQSDSPLIPIGSIERLHAIRPDRVDWVFDQTQIEAETRRKEQHRVNLFIFVERLIGMLAALTLGIIGVAGGIFVALQGHDWFGGMLLLPPSERWQWRFLDVTKVQTSCFLTCLFKSFLLRSNP